MEKQQKEKELANELVCSTGTMIGARRKLNVADVTIYEWLKLKRKAFSVNIKFVKQDRQTRQQKYGLKTSICPT